ncbi:transglycosylase SLT domain-containing protein [Pseudomonas syringae]|uniref:transglycosylase SLT domain-containing protein n=1 Tax=Pseudomonas syringae TaxID=317 RepID=UPI0002098DDF|nr:transglycosylase SLT domain-containing protein [Pseudomonas syringae]MDP5168594.1 transglycosylase SLT domain-containing protein [Pseudomonas syringae pv. aptata str. DSM 50252]
MAFLDLPPQMQERFVCSVSAAIKYQVPANIVLAVADKEAGKPGLRSRNSNGTDDVGTMQFNTGYLKDLERQYGITAHDVAQEGCYSYDLAAWRLRGHIKNDAGDIWTRAANYHSRTPQYNSRYRADLIVRADKWGKWLNERFVTFDPNSTGVQTVVAAATTEDGTDGTPNEKSIAVPQAALNIPQTSIQSEAQRPLSKRTQIRNVAAERALANMYAPGLMK